MSQTTEWGFPKGKVAKTLRQILYHDLSDSEVEAIVVCLLSHLLIENKINFVLYRWLNYDPPKPSESKKIQKVEDELWKNITNMEFSKKYSLLEPHFATKFPYESKNIWKINNLRNEIFHGRAIKEAKFEGRPISNEETVEKIFLCAQFASKQLEKFDELIDSPRALAEKWAKRLKELGEPLI